MPWPVSYAKTEGTVVVAHASDGTFDVELDPDNGPPVPTPCILPRRQRHVPASLLARAGLGERKWWEGELPQRLRPGHRVVTPAQPALTLTIAPPRSAAAAAEDAVRTHDPYDTSVDPTRPFRLAIGPLTTIWELKRRIALRDGMPAAAQQRLCFFTQVYRDQAWHMEWVALHNDRPLEFYGAKTGDRIELAQRVQWGGAWRGVRSDNDPALNVAIWNKSGAQAEGTGARERAGCELWYGHRGLTAPARASRYRADAVALARARVPTDAEERELRAIEKRRALAAKYAEDALKPKVVEDDGFSENF